MISNLGWETLQQRRPQAKLVMMYRITYGLIDISATRLLHPATLSTRGNSMRYLPPYCRTDTYWCSFFPSGIRLWNQLPEHVVTAPTLETFNGARATRSLLDATEECFYPFLKSLLTSFIHASGSDAPCTYSQ